MTLEGFVHGILGWIMIHLRVQLRFLIEYCGNFDGDVINATCNEQMVTLNTTLRRHVGTIAAIIKKTSLCLRI